MLDEFTRVTVQSKFVTNKDQLEISGDPRISDILENLLEAIKHETIEHNVLYYAPDLGRLPHDGRRNGSQNRKCPD